MPETMTTNPPPDVVTWSAYRLPDGRTVAINDDVARGAATVDFTLVSGEVVEAVRVEPELPDAVAQDAATVRAALDGLGEDGRARLRELATQTPAADLGARVMDRTLCLSLSIHRWGVSRKASMGAVTVQADKALCSLSKKLLASKKLTAIDGVTDKARAYLKETALPSFFKAGVYLVPMEMVTTIEAKLLVFRTEFDAAVAEFLAEYPALVGEMADPLGVLYNPLDYPEVGKVAATFGFEWRYVSFDVPGRLKAISAVMFEQERAKAAEKLAMAAEEVQGALRLGLKGLVDGLVQKLQPTEDGKRRRLTEVSVEKLQTFLATFDLRNVTDDAEMTALVARAREVIGGKDVEQLREDKDLRASVLAAFSTLQNDIEPLVLGRGTRTLDLDE